MKAIRYNGRGGTGAPFFLCVKRREDGSTVDEWSEVEATPFRDSEAALATAAQLEIAGHVVTPHPGKAFLPVKEEPVKQFRRWRK